MHRLLRSADRRRPSKFRFASLTPFLRGLAAFLLAVIGGTVTGQPEAEPTGPRARGLRPPTVAEVERFRAFSSEVISVRPNARALERTNEERRARGLAPLALPVVPDGQEILVAPRLVAAGSGGSLDANPATAALVGPAAPAAPAMLAASALPSAWDNSALAAFPPVRSQGEIGSCACFSSGYYLSTFMIAQARGLDVRNSGNTDKISPKFLYALVNDGVDGGSWFTDIFDILLKHGAPTWSAWPYSGVNTPASYLEWPVTSALWRGALTNRMASSYYLTEIDTEAGLARLKQYLANSSIVVFASNINGWQYGTVSDDPSTPDDNAFVGRPVCKAVQIDSSGHAMTIVGYNDNIWTDLNKNGVVDSGEKGALRIVNSWGTDWKDGGFVWVAYDALRTTSAVTGVGADITTNRAGSNGEQKAFWDSTVYGLNARASYAPQLMAEVTLTGVQSRNQFSVTLGRGATTATAPTTTYAPAALQQQGGAFAFNGTSTPVSGVFVLDLTDLRQSGANRYFVTVRDAVTGNAVTYDSVRLLDAQGAAVASGASGLPAQVDNATRSAFLDLSVTTASPSITSALTASGTVNAAFTYVIVATNLPTSYAASNLPAGLTLNAQSGTISGTPLSAGTTSVTVSATNALGTDTRTLSINIAAAVVPPVIASAATASGTSGIAFSYQISASNSPTSYSVSGSLPNGVSVNSATGLISGTPVQTGTFTFQVQATNAGGTGSRSVTLTIAAPLIPVPVITSATTASVDAGNLFNYRIQASGAVSFSAQNLPSGLTLDSTTGAITGRVTLARTYSITLGATNATGTGYATLTLEVRGNSSFAPANDKFANRIALSGTTATATGATTGATAETGEPAHAGSPAGTSVWWTWTAPSSGTLSLSTSGSTPAVRLALYTGTALSALSAVGPTATGATTYAVTSGTAYQLAVDSVANAVGSVSLSLSLSAPPVARPANDNFASASTLTGTTATASGVTSAATAETGEPAHATGSPAGKSVWYKWTATAAGACTVSTRGSNFDTVLAVYTGTAVNALTLVAGDDDSGGNSTSETTFPVTNGTTYFVAADGYGGLSGNLTFSLNFVAGATGPANDSFASATVLTGSSATASGTTTFAGRETGEPAHAGSPAARSVWFRWTATATGQVSVSTAGSNFDTVLAVYTGSAVGALQSIASNDEGVNTSTSALTFNATSGIVYSIAVDGYYGAAGNYTLAVSLSSGPPANNNFASAATLTAGVRATASNTLATAETGEPAHFLGSSTPNAAAKSVWWKWTATATGFVSVTTAGSSFDTVLAVYTGTALNSLTRVAENDEATFDDSTSTVFFRAVSGRTYLIAVDGYLGNSGSIVLTLTPSANPSIVYATDFERFSTGAGQLVKQEQWTEINAPAGTGAQGILSQGITGQGRAAYLGYGAPTFTDSTSRTAYVYRPLNFDPVTEGAPVVQVRADVLIVGSTNGKNDTFRLSLYARDGSLLGGFSFDTATKIVSTSDGSTRTPSSFSFAFNTRYTLLGTFNFATKRWTARINATELTVDTAFGVGTSAVDVGDFDFVWTLADAQRVAGDNFIVFDNLSITADPAPTAAPVVQLATAPSGALASALNYTVAATNGPILSYAATGLPAGLTLNAVTGVVSGTPTQAGTYNVTFTATNARGQSTATATTFTIVPGPPAITSAASATAELGRTFTHQIVATNSPRKYDVRGTTALPAGLSLNSASGLITGTPQVTGRYPITLAAENEAGAGTAAFVLTIAAAGSSPAITTPPTSQSVTAGSAVTFSVTAAGADPLTYQWTKNGTAISGATGSTYTIAATARTDAGSYAVVVTNSAGTATSTAAALTVDPSARLANVSARTSLASGQTLIVSFVVSGGNKNVLIRAAGPALAAYGLTSAMADPKIELSKDGTKIAENNDWLPSLSDAFASVAAFPFAPGSKDAAVFQSVGGANSALITGTGPGTVLVEGYDAGAGSAIRLVNLSARNNVGVGEDILIAGFNVAGTGTIRVLVRAIGPRLAEFGVTGALLDPKLELYDGSTKLSENDNWDSSLATTFASVAAFPLTAGSKDSAFVTSLTAGKTYTVQVSGVGQTTGEALIEVYELP